MRAWWLLGLAIGVGCGADVDTGEQATAPADTGETSEPVEPAAICETYLACLQVVDPGMVSTLQDQYGPDGACWRDAETAAACAEQCQIQLSVQNDLHPDVAECDDGLPDDEDDISGRWDFTLVTSGDECPGVTMDELRVIFEPGMDPGTLTAEVYLKLGRDGAVDTLTPDLPCTFDGTTVACEPVPDDDAIAYLDFDGTYAETSIDAVVSAEMIADGCTASWTLTGARY